MAYVDKQKGNYRVVEKKDKLRLSKTFTGGGRPPADDYCAELNATIKKILSIKYRQESIDFKQLPLSIGQWQAINNAFTIDCDLLASKLRPAQYTETFESAASEFCVSGYSPRRRVKKVPGSSVVGLVSWWVEYFGPEKLLTDVVKADIVAGLKLKSEGETKGGRGRGQVEAVPVSLNTLDNYLTAYMSFSHWCLLEGKIETRPEVNIKKQAPETAQPRPLGLKVGELEQFDYDAVKEASKALLKACKRSDKGDATPFIKMYVFVLFALTTGRRASEILNLKWSHINLKTGTYAVIAKGRKVQNFILKGKILPELNSLRKKESVIGIDGYIFTKPGDSKPFRYTEPFTAVIADAGLGDHYFHDLRDTCATLLLNRSMNWTVVAAVLGHSSVGALQKRYGRFFPEAVGDILDEHLADFLR